MAEIIVAWDKATNTQILPERVPVALEWARFTSGTRVKFAQFNEPIIVVPLDEITLTIEGDKAYNVMKLGETLNFTVNFSDLTLNTAIPASILDRQDNHVYNALITIKDGIGSGTFTPDKAMDYFITEAGINYHTDALNAKLILAEAFFIRVVGT